MTILKINLFEIGCLLIILRMSRTGAKGVPLPGGPAGAFAIAFGAVGAVYLMMKYVRRRVKNLLTILISNRLLLINYESKCDVIYKLS